MLPKAKRKSLASWLDYIEQLHHSVMDFGQERLTKAYLPFNLQLEAKVIVVAGTNGKGTFVHYLQSMLTALGYRVGTYMSPHLVKFNERISIDGKDISDDDLCEIFEEIESVRDSSMSFFEYTTLAAIGYFQSTPLDYVILEVGLGGRLDSVNRIEPDLSVITSIGYDHQAILGDTLEEIAKEKAGIMRAGKPVLYGGERAYLTLNEVAKEKGAFLHAYNQSFSAETATDEVVRYLPTDDKQLAIELATDLPRKLQALLLTSLSHLGFEQSAMIQALETLKVARPHCGRRQELSNKPLLVVDVAHNPDAIRYLFSQLDHSYGKKNWHVVFGMCDDKDILGCMQVTRPYVKKWYLTQMNASRSASIGDLERTLLSFEQHPSYELFHSVKQVVESVGELSNIDGILVVGSAYLVGEFLTQTKIVGTEHINSTIISQTIKS